MSERLREQLQERLLVALDFATLGAYELTAPEGDAQLAEAERAEALRDAEQAIGDVEHALGAAEPAHAELADALSGGALHAPVARRERPQRVFLFAKAVPACSEQEAPERPACSPQADMSLRAAGRRRPRRRAGMAHAPEQPCTWG